MRITLPARIIREGVEQAGHGGQSYSEGDNAALIGAGIGFFPGLLWYYLTDEADRNFTFQVILPTAAGAIIGNSM